MQKSSTFLKKKKIAHTVRFITSIPLPGANICISYFSIAVIRQHDQGTLQRKELIGGFQFQKVRVFDHDSGKHSCRQVSMVLEQSEGSHLEIQEQGRGKREGERERKKKWERDLEWGESLRISMIAPTSKLTTIRSQFLIPLR